MMEERGSAQGVGRAERQAAGTSYLSLIDGVRGVAALAVLLYHYVHFFMAGADRRKLPGYLDLYPAHDLLRPLYQYGFYAVQVFWLISGFVFAHVYYGHAGGTRGFFVNRLARLYPLHLLTLFVVAALQLIALGRLGYTPIYGNFDWRHFALQLVMAGDWVRSGFSFNGPFWSVSVEIVVYALFWLSRGAVARVGLALLVAMVVGFYFADHEWGANTRIFACGYYFFTGSALCRARRGAWGTGWRLALLAAACATAGATATAMAGIQGWAAGGIPGIFGALFLLLATAEKHAPAKVRRACEWLGENTYGVYLWHFPLQLTTILLLLPANVERLAQHGWFLALYVVLVVGIARLSFLRFERPMRDILRRRLRGGSVRVKGGDKAPAVR
jgi:peptidoglycan/LPS O-acetylase OafA/YrhL